MKKMLMTLSLAMLGVSFLGMAQAGTSYHVYSKNGECVIDMREPDTFKNQRGSGWHYVGKDSTRSGAEKIAKNAGCNL